MGPFLSADAEARVRKCLWEGVGSLLLIQPQLFWGLFRRKILVKRCKRWDEVEKTFPTSIFAVQLPGLGTSVDLSTLQSGVNRAS